MRNAAISAGFGGRFAMGVLLGFLMLNAPCNAQNIIAHRGASHDAPENTMAAFKLAWEQGADGIEGDWRLTKDARLVCIHDTDLQRVARDPRKVGELTFDEIRKLSVGDWKGKRFRGEQVPSLAEVLAIVPRGKRAFIELKEGGALIGLETELRSIEFDPRQIVVIAFDEKLIAECKRRMPELRCHWLTSFENRNGQWTPTPDEVARTLKACGADGVGFQAERGALNEPFLRDSGVKEFHVWTVDQPPDAAYFRRLGAWGITTNRPGWLREQLEGDVKR